MIKLKYIYSLIITLVVCLAISACGGGGGSGGGSGGNNGGGGEGSNFSVSVTVSGLDGGTLVLQNNGADDLNIAVNGVATFSTPIANNGSYDVSVKSAPSGQVCSVNNGIGSGVVSNITNVMVACSAVKYTVGGAVTGLSAGQIVSLENMTNGSAITVTGAGAPSDSFTFPEAIPQLGSYNVAITAQPDGQTCAIANNSGAGAGVTANVSNIAITCSVNTYNVSGRIHGLASGQQVTLSNNGVDFKTVSYPDGFFTFSTPLPKGSSYAVTVSQNPIAQTCTVANGSGTITGAVTDVVVDCAFKAFTVGGSVSGLSAGKSLTLVNNNTVGDAQTVTYPTSDFTFGVPVAYGSDYDVKVLTNPLSQTCSIENGSGTMATANVTNVLARCINRGTNLYAVSNNGNVLYQYTIGSTGALTAMSPASVALPAGGIGFGKVDPSGRYMYIGSASNNVIYQYIIGSTGALTAMSPASVVSGSPTNVSIAFDRTGKYAYVVGYSSAPAQYAVSQYTISSTGALTPMSPATIVSAIPFTPRDIAVDPTGKYAYVVGSRAGSIFQYTIGSTGALTPMNPATVAARDSFAISIDPSGKFAYATSTLDDVIDLYSIGSTGMLTAMSPASVASGTPWGSAIHPNGKHLYVTNTASDTVSQFNINTTTGMLTAMSPATVATGNEPHRAITIDPNGKYLYLSNVTGNTVSQYTINSTTGALTPMSPSSVPSGTTIESVTIR